MYSTSFWQSGCGESFALITSRKTPPKENVARAGRGLRQVQQITSPNRFLWQLYKDSTNFSATHPIPSRNPHQKRSANQLSSWKTRIHQIGQGSAGRPNLISWAMTLLFHIR